MQQLAPWSMYSVVEKLKAVGNVKVLLCDRGTAFGYGTLVNDMRSLPIMARYGTPVTIDATHSSQKPGGKTTGGNREMAQVIAGAAISTGIAGVFAEVHQDPDTAPSDGPNMIRLDKLEQFLTRLVAIDKIAKEMPLDIGDYEVM
jgi:2-dehydro-3-deoxyphosphooctonate aldolase (KDO 8-P synthase)